MGISYDKFLSIAHVAHPLDLAETAARSFLLLLLLLSSMPCLLRRRDVLLSIAARKDGTASEGVLLSRILVWVVLVGISQHRGS